MLANETIPSSRAKLFISPSGTNDPKLVGIVERFNTDENFASENLPSIGEFVPPDNVTNSKDGNFGWSRVHHVNPEVLAAMAPTLQTYAQFGGFDLLLIDPKDGRGIARCVDCQPGTLSLDVTQGRALRDNFRGICRLVQHGNEINVSEASAT